MSHLQRIRQLAARLGELDEARRYDEEAKKLSNSLEQLRAARFLLQAGVETATVLAANEALQPGELPSPSTSKESLDKIISGFEGDSRTLSSGRALNALFGQLKSTTDALNEATKAAWAAATSSRPRANEKLLKRIEEFPSQADNVRELRLAAAGLEAASKTPPVSQEQWDNYTTLRFRVEEFVGKLNSDEFPEDVLEFCRAAQNPQGAPLDLLTAEVKQWLQDNNMYKDLRLRLR